MKQILPFILIAAIVGAVMFFLNDDYEKDVFDPIATMETRGQYWKGTFFLEENSEEELEIGLKLETAWSAWEDVEPKLDAIEFFVNTQYGSFYYQDLDVEEFEGEITYSEVCNFCENIMDKSFLYGDVQINWREGEFVQTDMLQVELDWSEILENYQKQ